jgi:acetyltransferase EpsM
VQIGEGALVGIGATGLPHCRIGSWSVVRAGAVVLNDIPEGVVAVGVPTRVVRYVEKGVSNEKQ